MSSKPFTAKTFAWLRQINHSDRGRYLAVDLKVAVELTEYFREDDQDGRAYPSHKTLGDFHRALARTHGGQWRSPCHPRQARPRLFRSILDDHQAGAENRHSHAGFRGP